MKVDLADIQKRIALGREANEAFRASGRPVTLDFKTMTWRYTYPE